MLCVYFFSHRKKSSFPAWKTHPKQSHRCLKSKRFLALPLWWCCGWLEWQQRRECEHQVVNFKWPQTHLSSPRLLASEAHVGYSLYVLFPQGFRRVESSPFRRIRGTVRHYVLVVCSNVAVRLMGYPAKAEMMWSTTKDHLQVCRESALMATLTARGKNNTPAQASLQPPSSHACRAIQININKVDIISNSTIHSVHFCVFSAVVRQYSTAEESPTSVCFSLLWYFKLG